MGLLDGALSGILGGSQTDPNSNSNPIANPGGGGGLLPGLSLSLLGLPTLLPPPPTPGSSSAPASAASVSAVSAVSISQASSSPQSVSSASAVSSPPALSFTPTSSSPSQPPASATSPPDISTDANGVEHTVSNVVVETAPPSTTPSAAPAHSKSFLENKPLSGTVFGLAGLVALVLIVTLATCVFRRRRRNRLLDDAVSFDPSLLATADQYDGSEKGHSSTPSLGTLNNARPGYGTTYQAEQYTPYGGVQQPTYYGGPQPARQPEYYGNYGVQQPAQQPYYSAYVPPMADAPPTTSTLAPTTAAASRAPHNIPRVPVPANPLPEEFGSSGRNSRTSLEEAEFWAKTLKVTND